jgi:hypothetical protein
MKTFQSKHLLVLFLLFHGIVVNLLIFPMVFIYAQYNDVYYLGLSEWVKSICINLFTWQVVFYLTNYVPDSEIQLSLKNEFKKYATLAWVHRNLKVIFSNSAFRRFTLNISIWFIIIFNLFFSVFAVLIFNFNINLTFCCIWFISFQIVFFIFYYLNTYFPEGESKKEAILESPWFLDIILLKLINTKN